MVRTRHLLSTTILVVILTSVWPCATPAQPGAVPVVAGQPLPEGAVARLGTSRFNHGDSEVAGVAVSPDGKMVVSGRRGQNGPDLCLWEAATGKLIRTLDAHSHGADCLAFSPDGKRLAIGTWDYVRVLDVDTGQEVADWTKKHNEGFIRLVRFLDDGKKLLTADGLHSLYFTINPKTRCAVRLWDVASKKSLQMWTPPHQETPTSKPGDFKEECHLVDVSADGKLLVWGCAPGKVGQSEDASRKAKIGVLRVVEMATGKEVLKLQGPFDRTSWDAHFVPSCLALAPDGQLLALATESKLIVWRIKSGEKVFSAPLTEKLTGLVFAPDGKTLFSFDWRNLTAWDPLTGKKAGELLSASAFPNGFWPGKNGANSLTTGRLAFFPGATKLALAYRNQVRLLDARTGQEFLARPDHLAPAAMMQFTADGQTLSSVCADRCCLWDAKTWKLLDSFSAPSAKEFPIKLTFQAENRFLMLDSSAEAILKMHDVKTGKILHSIANNHEEFRVAGLSADGAVVALAGVSKGKSLLRFCQMATGKIVSECPSQNLAGPVHFSADGKLFAWRDVSKVIDATKVEAGINGVFRVVEVATGKQIQVIPLPQKGFVQHWDFAAAGQCLAAHLAEPGEEGPLKTSAIGPPLKHRVQVWHVASGRLLRTFAEKPGDSSFHLSHLTLSPDSRQIVFVAQHAPYQSWSIDFWEIASGTKRGSLKGGTGVLAFSPSGNLLANGCADTSILIFDVHRPLDGKQPFTAPLNDGDLAACWQALAQAEAAKADAALWALIASPKETLPLLKKHLQPAPLVKPELVQQWIVDLGSETFAVRSKATAELEKSLDTVLPALVAALKKPPSLEAHLRLEQLIAKANNPALAPNGLRQIRMVEVLEHIGTKEAQQLLHTLAQGAPAAYLTEQAQAALKRLKG